MDLEWPAGTMQVDFGQANFEYRGKIARMHYLAESFPQSNHALGQLFGDERTVCVCQGMKDTFEHIGGVPPLVVFDNATEVGRRVCSEIRESPLFKAFACTTASASPARTPTPATRRATSRARSAGFAATCSSRFPRSARSRRSTSASSKSATVLRG